mmetsp:Transcript_14077/g.60272  ORF Transcript_14077/g.60272 Transcript_14077/m.60272 type:complete len:300 (+) Transcript_14077:499-1398(+)
MQSVPVSPPPITTTFLPFASMYFPSARPLSRSDLVLACRNSMAKCTPSRARPSTGRSRGLVAPHASTTASEPARSSAMEGCPSAPMCALTTKSTPSAASKSARRCTISILSAFMLGTPYIMSPPTRSARSYTVTLCPALFSWSAAAMPAGPEPITTTFLPVRCAGGVGTIHPSANPRSTMEHSMLLIVTGFSMMPSVHDPSHGAGQTRPVNSGKLLVSCRRSSASLHRPWCTSSFHSGILFPKGHPVLVWWQNGVPQSMQRALCVESSDLVASAPSCRCTSFQSIRRSAGSRYPSGSRS